MRRALVLLSLVALSGCAGAQRHSHHPGHTHHRSNEKLGLAVALIRLGVVAVEAIATAIDTSSSSSHESSSEPAPSYEPPSGWSGAEPPRVTPATPAPVAPAAPAAPSSPPPADPDHVRFDPAAAHRVLNEVDLGPCRYEGLERGYVRASAMFGPDGRVRTVWVDEPAGLSDAATACVTARIGRAEVAPYHGDPVMTRATWYVR